MISIDSNFHSCKHPIQSIIHQPLQIRTNKHRCFVFCIGHTSLTCVPGIGKKNKHLLNQSGIHDLSTLYSKYRLINNIQQFKQWLQNEIGFTSYQAKMTTCGIGSKLGEIKEINTGLTPICCPSKERREEKYKLLSYNRNINKRNRSIHSTNKKNKEEIIKKRQIQNIKTENLSHSLNRDQTRLKKESLKPFDALNKEELLRSTSIDNSINTKETIFSRKDNLIFSPSKDKLVKNLSDDYLTGVKSPDNPIFARRPQSIKNTDESDVSSSPNKLSFDQKYEENEILKTKSMKLNSPESTSQSSSLLENNRISNTHSNKISSSDKLSKLEITQTPDNIDERLLATESSSISPRLNCKMLKSKSDSDQQKKNAIQIKKSSISHSSTSQQVDSTRSSELSMGNKPKSERSQTTPQVKATNHQSVNFPQLSTDDINLHGVFSIQLQDSRSDFHESIEKDLQRSSSLHTSIKDTDDNQKEQEFPSEKKKSVSHFNLSNSSDPKNDFEGKQELSIPMPLSLFDGLTADKFPVNNGTPNQILNDQTKTHPSTNFPLNDKTTEFNSTTDEKLNKIFTLTKQKLQPMLNALQDKKDELLSASKKPPDSSIANISPTKSKSMEKSEISNSIRLTTEDNLTPKLDEQTSLDSKFKTTSIIGSVSCPSHSPTTEKEDLKQHGELMSRPINDINTQFLNKPTPTTVNLPSSTSHDKWQESNFNRFDTSFNESEQKKFREEISKTVTLIMKQALHIAHKNIQTSQINSMPSTKVNSTESSSFQTPIFETKNHNDITSLSKQSSPIEKHKSSSSLINQFKNDKTNIKKKSLYEKLKSNTDEIALHSTTNSLVNEIVKTQSNLANTIVKDTGSILQNSHLDAQLDISLGPEEMSQNRLLTLKEASNDQSSNTENESVKQSSNKKKSLSTLSSLSDSNQSIDKTQSDSNNINRFEKEIEIKTNNDSEKFNGIIMLPKSLTTHENLLLDDLTANNKLKSILPPVTEPSVNNSLHSSNSLTISSPNIIQFPTEHRKQSSLTSLTLFHHRKNDKLNTAIMPSNRVNQLPLSPIIKENQYLNENLSETINSKENSELKRQTVENHELKINSNSTDSEHQSILNPSSPSPCNALWDNISNEEVLSQRKNHCLTSIEKKSV